MTQLLKNLHLTSFNRLRTQHAFLIQNRSLSNFLRTCFDLADENWTVPPKEHLASEIGVTVSTINNYISTLKKRGCWPFHFKNAYNHICIQSASNAADEKRLQAAKRAKEAKCGIVITDEDIDRHLAS